MSPDCAHPPANLRPFGVLASPEMRRQGRVAALLLTGVALQARGALAEEKPPAGAATRAPQPSAAPSATPSATPPPVAPAPEKTGPEPPPSGPPPQYYV